MIVSDISHKTFIDEKAFHHYSTKLNTKLKTWYWHFMFKSNYSTELVLVWENAVLVRHFLNEKILRSVLLFGSFLFCVLYLKVRLAVSKDILTTCRKSEIWYIVNHTGFIKMPKTVGCVLLPETIVQGQWNALGFSNCRWENIPNYWLLGH